MAFVDSTIERFNSGGFTNFFGNPNGAIISANAWGFGVPGSNYNHAIRHPNNGTNVGYIDGHVQTLYNRQRTATNGQSGLSLAPSLAKGDFVVNPSDP
jgi:prepilin-type processing-associated H-X9-DG protein